MCFISKGIGLKISFEHLNILIVLELTLEGEEENEAGYAYVYDVVVGIEKVVKRL